jgi:hypothetical protein
VQPVRNPWWKQATALVAVTTGGAITGLTFVPGAAETMTSPSSVPLHLLALEQAAHTGDAANARAYGADGPGSAASDQLLRSAIVNVAKYYLQLATTRPITDPHARPSLASRSSSRRRRLARAPG